MKLRNLECKGQNFQKPAYVFGSCSCTCKGEHISFTWGKLAQHFWSGGRLDMPGAPLLRCFSVWCLYCDARVPPGMRTRIRAELRLRSFHKCHSYSDPSLHKRFGCAVLLVSPHASCWPMPLDYPLPAGIGAAKTKLGMHKTILGALKGV